MARHAFFITVFLLYLISFYSRSAAAGVAGAGDGLDLMRGVSLNSGLSQEDEFDLSYPEPVRRMLATSGYISYAALRSDSVPCDRRGASYYNCRPGAQANPYSRGCSAITRCRN